MARLIAPSDSCFFIDALSVLRKASIKSTKNQLSGSVIAAEILK